MKKLKLNDLKVNSFVTSMEQKEKETVKGGGATLLCLTGQYPTLPVNNCVDVQVGPIPTNRCFTGNYPTFNSPC